MATPNSGANSTATNQDAISAIADDGKKRECVFARRTGREADGNEAGDRHQRTGKHREGVGSERKCRGLHLVVAFGQAA